MDKELNYTSRRSGRLMDAIASAAALKVQIICYTQPAYDRVKSVARHMKLDILEPVKWWERNTDAFPVYYDEALEIPTPRLRPDLERKDPWLEQNDLIKKVMGK